MKTGMELSHLWELCYQAHRNTSFSPEKRADLYVREYSELLLSDLAELGEKAGNYREKFIKKFSAWMRAKGSCMSSMITGPANFPVQRARKANDRERFAAEQFDKWREGYFKAVNRKRTLSPEEEVECATARLDDLVIYQEAMKWGNKVIRKTLGKRSAKNPPEEVLAEVILALRKEEYSDGLIKEALSGDSCGYIGFPSYRLTNNNATIKRMREKVLVMQARIKRKEDFEDILFEGGYVTIEDDRVKIFHDTKPSEEVRAELKSHGFRWSPHWGCWCRKHTGNAVAVAKNLSFVKGSQISN